MAHVPDPASWFLLLWLADVEENAVAGLHEVVELLAQLDTDSTLGEADHAPDANAAALREPAADELLMVVAFEEPRGQPAAERLREVELLAPREGEGAVGELRVDRLAVGL